MSEVQQLAAEAVDPQRRQVRDRAKLSRFNFALIRESWINEDGTLVLSDADYEALVGEPNSALETLTNEISAFNRLGDKSVTEAKKNLETTQNGVFGIN